MPHTPEVFPRKRRWKLDRQRDHKAYLDAEQFEGVTCRNYPSVATFAKEVSEVLHHQGARGQILILSENEA